LYVNENFDNKNNHLTVIIWLILSAGTYHGYELDDFVGARFYCLYALADGIWHIQIKAEDVNKSHC